MSLAEQFPGSAAALRALAELVGLFRAEAARSREGLELEVRFGNVTGPMVTTGVSADFVSRTMAMVQSNPALRLGEWDEVEDVFFDSGGVEARSRSEYDTDKLTVETHVITKRRLGECRVRSGGVAMRFVLSREVPITPSAELVMPKHVRIQQRKRATFGAWAIDFGMVWSGTTKVEAERRQKDGDCPQYTFEIELLDGGYVDARTDEHVACSLGMKAADFVDAPHLELLRTPEIFSLSQV